MFSMIDKRLQQIKENNEPFGGVSMLLLGDFNQLHPVLDPWIFKPSSLKNAYSTFANVAIGDINPQWSLFSIYRLDEIMRQAGDKKFAEALTRLGERGLMGLTDEDVALFDSRIVQNPEVDIPDDAIYLYHTNENKNAMNDRQVAKRKGELFVNQAEYNVTSKGAIQRVQAQQYIDTQASKVQADKSNGLAHQLNLKVGLHYMIFQNLDVADGLANGTTGILRKVVKTFNTDDNLHHAQLVWIEFEEENIGRAMRSKHKKLYENARLANDPIPPNWTPLYPSRVLIRGQKSGTWSVERVQLPIEVAEAITIDKAQGQTYARVGFDLNQKNKRGLNTLTRAHLYVALSRVRRLEDLYLFGLRSIMDGKALQFAPEAQRLAAAEKSVEKEDTHIEMERMLDEAPFDNIFPFTEMDYRYKTVHKGGTIGLVSVFAHNVAGLHCNFESIKADYGCMNADVLVFIETGVKTCETSIAAKAKREQTDANYYGEYAIPGYTLVHMGSSRDKGAKHGCALYIRKSQKDRLRFNFFGDNSGSRQDGVYKSNDVCELAMFEYLTEEKDIVCVVYGYNHPKSSIKQFYKELKQFMRKYLLDKKSQSEIGVTRVVYLIGDFNCDLRKVNKEEKGEDFEYISKIINST